MKLSYQLIDHMTRCGNDNVEQTELQIPHNNDKMFEEAHLI